MRAILVIDVMPSKCEECPLYVSECLCGWCVLDVYDIEECPLKPLPQMKWHEEDKENECEEWYKNGWNDCLEEIEK